MAKKEGTKNIKEELFSEDSLSIKDGFKFGFGFFLACMLVIVLIIVSVILIAYVLKALGINLYV